MLLSVRRNHRHSRAQFGPPKKSFRWTILSRFVQACKRSSLSTKEALEIVHLDLGAAVERVRALVAKVAKAPQNAIYEPRLALCQAAQPLAEHSCVVTVAEALDKIYDAEIIQAHQVLEALVPCGGVRDGHLEWQWAASRLSTREN